MFDIGFSEIVVCAVVALIVIGPERLPETVRTAGLWIGRLKRSLRETRVELERSIGVDDIRRQLHNEDIMHNIDKVRKDINSMLEQAKAENENLINPPVYTSEPELPDHAHMNEDKPLLEHKDVQIETKKTLKPSPTSAVNISAPTDSTKTP